MPNHQPARADHALRLADLQPMLDAMLADDIARGHPDHALDWLRSVLDSSPVPTFVKEAAGPLLLVNRAQAEVWGMQPSDLEGRDDRDLIALGMHDSEQAERHAAVERGLLTSGETVCSAPITVSVGPLSGQRYRTLKSVIRVEGSDRILGVSFPIGCLAPADQDMVACLVDWIHHHPLGACLQDADDCFVALNADLAEVLGDTAQNLVGCGLFDTACQQALTAQSLLVFCAQNALVRARGQAYATPEIEMEGSRCARWTVQTLKVPLSGPHGSPYVLTISVEPRDRRRLLSQIAANEEMLRTVFDSCLNPLFVKDDEGRFVMVNPAMASLHNLTPEQMEQMSEWDLRAITGIPEEDVRRLLSEDHQVIANRHPLVMNDVAYRAADGLTHWHHTIKTPISLHGEEGYVLGVSTDMTENRRIKSDLERKTAQLEQMVAAIRGLTGTLDIQEVLERTAREAKAMVGSDNAVILRLDATDEVLIPLVAHDLIYSDAILRDRIPLDDSLTGKAIAAGKGLLFNDPPQVAGAHNVPGTPAQSNERLMAIPLIAEGNVLGAMCLQRDGEPFSQENLSLAEAFAAYAASALRDAMAHERLQQEVATRRQAQEELAATSRRQEQLIRAAQHLTTSIELDRVLERIARQARRISDSDAAAILQLETDGFTLTPIVAIDETYATELLSTTTTIDASVTGAAIKAGRAVILNDLQSSMPRHHVPGTGAADDARVIAAPLITEDRIIGALCLNREGRPYSQQELQLVEAFAAYATAVLRNARHHQQLHDTQTALAQERDQSQRYLDIAGVILMTLDTSLRVTMINRMGCELLNRPEAEIIGQDWLTLAVAAEHRDQVRRALQNVLCGHLGPNSERENPVVAQDGRRHHILWHNAPITDGRGEITGILSSGSDISARVAAEASREWESRVSSALSRLYRPLVAPDATLEGIAQAFLDESLALVDGRYGFVTLIDPDTQAYRMAVMNDALCDLIRSRVDLDEDWPAGRDDEMDGACRPGARRLYQALLSNEPYAGVDLPLVEGQEPIPRYLRVPVTLGDKLVGQIGLSRAPDDWCERDLQAMERISEYFALAIQRLEQARALRDRAHQQQQLLETAKTLNQSLDLERVLHDIGESARGLLQAHGCAIYRLESDGVTLTPLVSIESPHEQQIMATPLHIDESFTGWGIKAGHGLIFNSAREQGGKQIPGTPDEENERVIVAPFVADGGTLGAMCLNRLGRDFSQEDLSLAETFATYAANAMRNAQRHQRLADAREALAVSEARFRGVVEHGQDGLLIIEHHRVVYANDRLREIFGYGPQDAVPGIKDPSWLATSDMERFRHVFGGVLVDLARPAQVELHINRPDGSEGDIWARYTPIYSEGDMVGGFILITDMTERMRAERQLRASEERYRTVVESINDVIFVCDLDGVIRYISPVIERVTGHTADDWLDSPLADWALPDEREDLAQHLQDVISGRGRTHTFGLARKDGSQAMISCSCRLLLGHEGQPATISGRLTDMTEQLQLEARLRQSQKMETVGRLAGGVAHDFNNLLTVINGFSEMLLSTMPADAGHRSDIEQINEAGVRAADLVRRLLAFSRQQPVESTVVDVNEVVLGLSGMLPRMIGEHVEIQLEAGATPSSVYAGRSELEQILINLAANARDAIAETPQGIGRIEIRTLNLELPEGYIPDYMSAHAGAYVCLQVQDTGSGMDEPTRGRIFEPFFTTKEVDKGTGLGLAIVYGLVEEMGGCIDVETATGQGTCFRICLPLTLEAPEPLPEERPVTSLSGQGVVMVIEDQEQVRRFACQMLRHMGYSVIACASSREAVARLAVDSEHPPDLLLVDVVMPGQSGPELVREIRQAWPQMRALYMSGYSRNELPPEAQLEQQGGLLRKPFSLAELGEAVQRAMAD